MTDKLDADETAGRAVTPGRRTPRLRQRVAWMYYVDEMTQSAIADVLGIGRITVVRLLSEARALREVHISLTRDIEELTGLEFALQRKFGVAEAIVAPLADDRADCRAVIAAAAGEYVSEMLQPDMKVGLGWGNTLMRVLDFVSVRQIPRLSVVSLLGGITRARQANPAEFAWQFARLFLAECYLVAAPAVVDSPATKRALIERCGLKEVFDFAKTLDAIVVSAGTIKLHSTTDYYGTIFDSELQELRARGAVGDILYNFFDINGRIINHSVNKRNMSVPIETLCATPTRVLVSGGEDKIDALIGAMELLRPTAFITDEGTAASLLAYDQKQAKSG
jgi:DNA-binding transcriptional regulator LsrR (DeoR family)